MTERLKKRLGRGARGGAYAAALGLALSAWAGGAVAEDVLQVMTSPSGSGPYNAFATIQTHMEEFSDSLTIEVEETPGFTFNVKIMATDSSRYTDTIFGTGTVLSWAAATGQKPFFPEPLEVAKDFRVIAGLGPTYNVWVTTDPEIETPKDFVGKRVGIGLLTQNEWGMHQRMLLDAWGLTPELRSLDALGTSANIEALLDGRTQVGTLFGLTSVDGEHTVVTGPHRQLEASDRDWHYVQVPAEMIRAYNDRTGAPFRVVDYAAGTLPNQPDRLVTFGDILLLQAHKDLPDDLAYEFVRMMVENYEKIASYSALTRVWTPATLAEIAKQSPDLVHPGAMKAYRDLGLVQ
ncbi:MAG: hypothetical protein Kilf2KO_22160 [Rhodospirillales bacterium]